MSGSRPGERSEPAKTILVLSTDLMDRSKISAALPNARMVRSLDAVVEQAAAGDLVIVDLQRVDDIERLRSIDCPVIAFGSHVDQATLEQAERAGAEALARSVFFRRLGDGAFGG